MNIHAHYHASAKGEKLAQRVSHIVALLHQGGYLDKSQLAQPFGVNVRIVQPVELHDALVERLRQALAQWKD